ncbi:hypothetical protein BH11PLA1_BH11PLA1_03710 [soil metagenome]
MKHEAARAEAAKRTAHGGVEKVKGGTGAGKSASGDGVGAQGDGALSDGEIAKRLRSVPEWSHVGEAIQRTFAFKDFVEAMAFVDAVAREAERAQHHPDILIRYRKVTMTLSTHDAQGITEKDFALAGVMDGLAG